MTMPLSPEQQTGLDQLGVTLEQFQFYHARRIDGRYVRIMSNRLARGWLTASSRF